jgi:Putative zinc-finger
MTQFAECAWVEERLSAYIDKEVGEEERLQIEEHCDNCEKCRVTISEFVALGSLMRQSETCVDTEPVWDKVASILDKSHLVSLTAKPNLKSLAYAILATAASAALIWIALRSNPSIEDGPVRSHDHSSLAVDFQEVIEHAKIEPQEALEKLVAKYKGQELDRDAATKYLGYEPAIFRSVPQGFARLSTHVLNMPCCKCSATICKREDGTSMIVFEHKDEQPVWFGDWPSIEAQCSGKTCKIVESAGTLVVSWKNDDRQVTLIGANDTEEINQWVESLKL